VIGEPGVARLLEQTLKEEKAADQKLTSIAESKVNRSAAKEYHERATAGDMLQRGAEWVGAAVGSASNAVRRAMPRTKAADRSRRPRR
jgi:hypothetical protein